MSNDSTLVRALNGFAAAFQRHWLAFVIGILLVYSLLPFVAPLLMRLGLTNAAQFIYKPYQGTCHTFAFRSFFLFGEQPLYARGDPGAPGEFERYSGIDVSTVTGAFEAREFQGNPRMGYKVALCERDLAIYFSIALNGMLFAAMRRKARMLPWPLFLLIGILPIGLDGFSQLFSQPPFNLIAFRESNWMLRLLTGSLFGTSVAWLIFPLIAGTMENDN